MNSSLHLVMMKFFSTDEQIFVDNLEFFWGSNNLKPNIAFLLEFTF